MEIGVRVDLGRPQAVLAHGRRKTTTEKHWKERSGRCSKRAWTGVLANPRGIGPAAGSKAPPRARQNELRIRSILKKKSCKKTAPMGEGFILDNSEGFVQQNVRGHSCGHCVWGGVNNVCGHNMGYYPTPLRNVHDFGTTWRKTRRAPAQGSQSLKLVNSIDHLDLVLQSCTLMRWVQTVKPRCHLRDSETSTKIWAGLKKHAWNWIQPGSKVRGEKGLQ